MSKHTPGPWQSIKWTYHSTSTIVVDDPSVVTGKRVIAECATEEDARLIAAAPALLAFAQSLVDAWEGGGMPYPYQIASAARDAIAKATGEQP